MPTADTLPPTKEEIAQWRNALIMSASKEDYPESEIIKMLVTAGPHFHGIAPLTLMRNARRFAPAHLPLLILQLCKVKPKK